MEGWPSGLRRRFAKPLYGDKPYRGFESPSLRHPVSVAAESPDISLKTAEFLGFSAQVGGRRPSPRGRYAGIVAAVSVWQFCGSVSLLTG